MASVEARKKAPPEKPEAVSLRTKIVFSFWAIILFIGVPVWHKTTSIYRATLPLSDMLAWADSANNLPPTPLEIWVHSRKPCAETLRMVQETQAAIDDQDEHPLLHQRLRLVHSEKEEQCGDAVTSLRAIRPALEIWMEEPKPVFSIEVQPGTSTWNVYPSSKSPGSISIDLAGSLRALFSDEKIAHALQIKAFGANNQHAQGTLRQWSPEDVGRVEKQLSRAAKASPTYHLTLSLFTASGRPSSWDIQSLLDKHIEPLRRALSSTANINIATQVQLYSSYSPSIQPFEIEGQPGYFLRQNDLTAFVNAAEWPLSPSVGSGPTLNFIIYVPHQKQLPLRIEGGQGQSWLVPQWGGIHIVNPALYSDPVWKDVLPEHLANDELTAAFDTFASQLLSLMGVLPLSSPQTGLLPLAMRLQAHKRLSALTIRMKAASSLGSLARLAQHLSNIPIPKHVAELVDNAMSNLTASASAYGQSRWDDAVQFASIAYEDSEKAFFDKSMVGQVYFPDEHKVAVYLPLLGPIGVPLLVGLMREIKGLLARRKSKIS